MYTLISQQMFPWNAFHYVSLKLPSGNLAQLLKIAIYSEFSH